MSLEVFEKLEAKVQQAIDTITLLQMEIEELKEKTTHCRRKFKMPSISEELERENNHLKEQQNGWQERLQALAGSHGRGRTFHAEAPQGALFFTSLYF